MAGTWNKILLEGDAAAPSDDEPQSVATLADKGVSATCSRSDHVHDTAAGFIDNADKFGTGVVDTTALGPDAVTGDKIQ